jgi:hypothetical protein
LALAATVSVIVVTVWTRLDTLSAIVVVIAWSRLVTGVDDSAASDLGDGVGDAACDRHDRDGGDYQDSATNASVHGSPSSMVFSRPRAAGFEGLSKPG